MTSTAQEGHFDTGHGWSCPLARRASRGGGVKRGHSLRSLPLRSPSALTILLHVESPGRGQVWLSLPAPPRPNPVLPVRRVLAFLFMSFMHAIHHPTMTKLTFPLQAWPWVPMWAGLACVLLGWDIGASPQVSHLALESEAIWSRGPGPGMLMSWLYPGHPQTSPVGIREQGRVRSVAHHSTLLMGYAPRHLAEGPRELRLETPI